MFEYGASSDAELIGSLQDAERRIAVAQAEQLAVIAELNGRAPGWLTTSDPAGGGVDPLELTAAEVAAALRISRLSATRRTELALEVCSRLPGTLAALGSGQISMAKLRVIVEATEVLSSEHAGAVEQRVLARAPSQTPAGLGASVARAVIRSDPSAAERRRLEAVRERSVAMFPGKDGIATLWLRAPAARVMNAYRRIVEVAESARVSADDRSADDRSADDRSADDRSADDRSADARRADTLLDLILDPLAVPGLSTVDAAQSGSGSGLGLHGGGKADRDVAARAADVLSNRLAPRSPSARSRPRWEPGPGTVHVTVAWTTLAGLDDLPGQVAGYGPITAEYARELAGDATWRRILTGPATGAVLDVGTTTYVPPAAMAAHVRARDGTCRWPGCRQPARRCDLDHTNAFPRGPTAANNLAALCRSHHRLKTHTGWEVAQHPGGVLTWTSPTGQKLTTHPWATDPDTSSADVMVPAAGDLFAAAHANAHAQAGVAATGPSADDSAMYDDDPPADTARAEPDWLDAQPDEREVAAQLARYDAIEKQVWIIRGSLDTGHPDAA